MKFYFPSNFSKMYTTVAEKMKNKRMNGDIFDS